MSSDPQHPLVSVVIPAWNAADTLPSTLETVFAQTWPSVQVVVVDDGSTDGTADVLASYGEQITWESIANSGGPSRPRNRGVALSEGAFIAFFDSDDLMEPDKLARAMAVLGKHPEVGLVCSEFRSINPAGQILQDEYLQGYRRFRGQLSPTELPKTGLLESTAAFQELLRANFVGTSSVVCRHEALAAAGPFDESMKNADDIDMWLRMAAAGTGFAFIDQALHAYRITPGGVTARGAARIPAIIAGLEKQIPHCRREEDRAFIRSRVRELHLERGWLLRESGDTAGSIASYREGLAIRWGWRPWIACLKARWQKVREED